MRNVTALRLVSCFKDFLKEMVRGVLPNFIFSCLEESIAILGATEGSCELTSYAFRIVFASLSISRSRYLSKLGTREFLLLPAIVCLI
jgi:hypothetical protein